MTMTNATHRQFERTVLPLREPLYGAAMRLTRAEAEADDLVQDTLLRAFRFWDRFEQGTNVKAWLFTILRNTFINRYHKNNRRADMLAEASQTMRALGPTVALGRTGQAGQFDAPDSGLARTASATAIRVALGELPEVYRRAVELADIEGLPYEAIAAELGCPMGTVMSRVHRGREQLHALLHEHALELSIAAADSVPGERRTQYTRTPRRAAEAVA